MTKIKGTKSKYSLFRRGMSLLLALVILATATAINAYAASSDVYYSMKQIDAPVDDGVYYADINLMNATQNSYSMGNAALRGSQSFLAKNPNDTDYKAIVVVKDGKATAIVEFMPMGYIGQAGFMMELEAVQSEGLTRYGGIEESVTTYTPATVLAQHRTIDGEIVYDSYNDPDSDYKFDGSNPSAHTRPAGFGYSESRLVNIVDVPYSHVLALDVTPIQIEGGAFNVPNGAETFTQDNAAYVHVFVPVMFSISASSGDQYARMMVDWANLEKIEAPETILYYQLYNAMQIEKGNYTSESYNTLQSEINDSVEAITNIWPSQHLTLTGTGFNKVPELNMIMPDENVILEKLNAAVDGLELVGDKAALNELITKAQGIDEALYTEESYFVLEEKLNEALKVKNNDDAGVSAVEKAQNDLSGAIEALSYRMADYSEVNKAISSIPSDLSVCTDETAQAVKDAQNAVEWNKNILEQSVVDGYAKAISEAVGKLEYKGADYSAVTAVIAKIPADLSIYTDETVKAVKDAQEAVAWDKNITEQDTVDAYAKAIENAVSALEYKPADYSSVDAALEKVPSDLSLYTDETAKALTEAVNAVVRGKNMSEQDTVNSYAKAIERQTAALEYKPADYASVDEALNKIPANLSVYTDESVKTLEDAQNAVIRNKNITEQETVDNYAKSIEAAVNNLEYKAADYSKVDIALASIPSDLSGYTDESVQAVKAARDSVVRGKNITEQSAVDAMADAIVNAVAKLENKSDSLDKMNLEDGVYSIYGEMIKVNRQDMSMSNEAINHTIKLTVENGKYYLTIDFNGLTYLNKFGYLAKLSYYDNGYTYGQYGKVNGNLIPAEILSTQKNADGSDVIDEFNQPGGSSEGLLYPDLMKFPLVTDALNDEDGYVPLHVFVPVMEDISDGTGDQDVLLKLNWSTLTKTTEDDPAFEPTAPVEQSPAVDITDASTGIKVNADKGVFEEGIKVVVIEISSGADYDRAALILDDVGKKFKLYDIKFIDSNGNEVAPNGTVTISLPIAAGYDSDNLAVYRINSDGSKTLVNGKAEDGYYTIVTKTAGVYSLIEKGSDITDYQNSQNMNNSLSNVTNSNSKTSPNTGAPDMGMFAVLAFACLGVIGFIGVSKKRKVTE